jgi:hypothetical protein
MRNEFEMMGLAAIFLALASAAGYAQTTVDRGAPGSTTPRPLGRGSVTITDSGTTVFRGAAGNAAELPASTSPDGSAPAIRAGSGGTTVFHGAPGGTSSRLGLPGASPPAAPPGPGVDAGR